MDKMNILKMDETKKFLRKLLAYGLLYTVLGAFFTQQAMAFQAFPRSPKPIPKFPKTQTINPKPHIVIGTKPKVDLRNVGRLPDLKIIQIKPKLNSQAITACRTGSSPYGGLVGFNLKVKNIGKGEADLSQYNFAVHATSIDGKNPAMKGGDGYGRARRTPARVAPGQTFSITGASGVVGGYYGHTVTFPVSKYVKLAGKTRRFKVELATGKNYGHGLPESNYRNNAKTVSYTFPRNFCKSTVHSVRPVGVPVSTLPAKHPVIKVPVKTPHIQTTPILKDLILTEIRRVLSGLSIHLNNHGAKHPDSVHDRSWLHNDSYIVFQGRNNPLNLPEVSKKIGRHHYYYYVNDFNLKNIDVSTDRGMIRLAFTFEDQGSEVKGHCLIKRRKHLGGWSACPVGSDKGAPDINLTHPTFVALVQPRAIGGSISFGAIDISYTGGVLVNGALRPLSSLATDMMRKALHKGLTDMISHGTLRNQIASNIRHTLDDFHIGYVTSVRLNGRNFVVTSRN